MSTLFIADLHLSERHPKITSAFFSFLETKIDNIDALYILGDLFEVWIGDDEHTPLMDAVALKIATYSSQNEIPVYYLHGNRDFMIGKRYAAQSSMILLPEHQVIQLYGQPILLMHGDTLCLADKNYQKLRKVLHNSLLQFIFNCLPLRLRKKIGWKIRSASQSKKVYKNNDIMDVTQHEVERLLLRHQCATLIHGHTHKAAKHNFIIKNQHFIRFDVGDWFNQYSYVEVNKDNMLLHFADISR